MILESYPLYTKDGMTLSTQWARPSSNSGVEAPEGLPPLAAIVFTHGLGEYSGRYAHVLEHFTDCGLEVFTYDLRGHGRSSGRRGDAPGLNALLEDLSLFLEATQARRSERGWGKRPLFLYGHSMGGLLTLSFLQRYCPPVAVAGAVIASPWLRLAFEPPQWKLLLGRIARTLCPGWRQVTGLDRRRVSRDQAFIDNMPGMDLVHQQVSARLFYDLWDESQRVLANAEGPLPPLLFLHGQADPVTSWEATREFYERAGSKDKTLLLYPEAAHETHNDLDRKKVLDDAALWLRKQTEALRGMA